MIYKFPVRRKGSDWFIYNVPQCGPLGPYSTKLEAESSRQGLEFFYNKELPRLKIPQVSMPRAVPKPVPKMPVRRSAC